MQGFKKLKSFDLSVDMELDVNVVQSKTKLSLLLSRLAVVLAVAPSQAFAGKIVSYCYAAENNPEVRGVNINEKLPIASVSKLVTSLWASTTKGANYKFATLYYVIPVGGEIYDVHIKGALDPYFNEQTLHLLISKLNELKVYKIRNFTFDENFKFYFNPNGRQIVPGERGVFNPVDSQRPMDAPSPQVVEKILSNRKQWLLNYNKTLKSSTVEMVKNPRLAIDKIKFARSEDIVSGKKATGFIRSTELVNQLKMMNWNSNNHAANTFFNGLGGKKAFDDYIYKKIKMKPDEIEFVNGSGNNEDFSDGPGKYNQASCQAIVRLMKGLKKGLEVQKYKFEDVVAVVGADRGATVARYAGNIGIMDGAAAKSGTVVPNVALAGMIHTVKGNFFFMYNYKTTFPRLRKPSRRAIQRAIMAEWTRGRNAIGIELAKLVKATGGAISLDYKARNFELESFEDDENDIGVGE